MLTDMEREGLNEHLERLYEEKKIAQDNEVLAAIEDSIRYIKKQLCRAQNGVAIGQQPNCVASLNGETPLHN